MTWGAARLPAKVEEETTRQRHPSPCGSFALLSTHQGYHNYQTPAAYVKRRLSRCKTSAGQTKDLTLSGIKGAQALGE